MKWKALTMPKEVVADEDARTDRYTRFYLEPLERGFGHTFGQALRRVLISSIQGAAVTSIRVDGVLHEFSTLPGVLEDVTDIVLNIKRIRPRLETDEPRTLVLEADKTGKYTAGDLVPNPDVAILNPEQHILELTKDEHVRIEMTVSSGRGYATADMNRQPEQPVGIVTVDSVFSPVVKVHFHVENTRVGQRTDYDRLILDMWTDGTMTPSDALSYAAKIVKDHMQMMITIDETFEEETVEELDEEALRVRELLRLRVDELELSVRSSNCLRAANILSLRELVSRSESEMLKYRNFGRKSLTELNAILSELGLHFGMDVTKFEELGDDSDEESAPDAHADTESESDTEAATETVPA